MTSPVVFVRQTIEELKQVTWPKTDEVVRMTMLVIVISLLVGGFIGILDFAFTNAVSFLLNR